MKLTFADEFNNFSWAPGGSYGTWNTGAVSPDGTKGRNLTAAGQNVYYSDASVGYDPYSVDDGVLTISAVKGQNNQGLSYTSGMMSTASSFSQTYGYFEMRGQLPEGRGFWPAFWMVRRDGKAGVEIDTLEAVGSDPGRIVNSVHSTSFNSWNQYSKGTVVGDTANSFHTYGVNWTPQAITFYFDGAEIYKTPTPWDLKSPMFLIANLGIGKASGWGGAPDSKTEFPGEFKIDYIRAYANEFTSQIDGRAALKNRGGLEEITPATNSDFRLGDNDYKVVGDPSNARVILGDGDDQVDLGGWSNSITLGNGNHTVTLRNDNHVLALGDGDSIVTIKGNSATVKLGDTTRTSIDANGYHQTVVQEGNGAVVIRGPNGSSTITLGDGGHDVNLTGSNNKIVVGDGDSKIYAGTMNNSVVAGEGDSLITVPGWSNFVDAGGGNDVIIGGRGNSVYVLDWLGDGRDTIRNFIASDKLDLGKSLLGLSVKSDLSNIGDYLKVTVSGGNTILSVDADQKTSTPPIAIATLQGVEKTLGSLLAWNNIIVSKFSPPAGGSEPVEPDVPFHPSILLDGAVAPRATLLLRADDLAPSANGVQVAIDNFGGAGGWHSGNNDFVAFLGFGRGSSLTFDRMQGDGHQIYDLRDTNSGHVYEIAVASLNGQALVRGDYAFY